MSWEVLSEKEVQCPCRRDTYTIKIKSDDWGRIEEFWTMNCPDCLEKYRLNIKHTMDMDGINAEILNWKLKK